MIVRFFITLIILLAAFNASFMFTAIKAGGYSFKKGIKEFWYLLLIGNVGIPFFMVINFPEVFA